MVLAVAFNAEPSFATESTGHRSRERRLVTIEAVLGRKVRSVSNVWWYDSNSLIGDFTESDSGLSATRIIALDGSLGIALGEGRLSSTSPDGRLLLQNGDDGWVVRNLYVGGLVRIEKPVRESRAFSSYTRPVWSRDGSYAAIAEHYRPMPVDKLLEPMTMAGVPVIDVGSQTSPSQREVSRITIFDRSTQTEVQRILLDDLVIPMAWGPDNTLYVSKTNYRGQETTTSVLRIQPGEQEVKPIYRSAGRFLSMTPAVSPDGSKIALALDLENRTWDDFTSILLIDAETGREMRRLTKDLPILGADYIWSPGGDEIYARVRNGGLDQIYAIPLAGEPQQLTQGARRHFNMKLSPDGRQLSYRTEDGYGRKDIRVLDIETRVETVVLILDRPAAEFMLGEWRHVHWTSSNGVKPFGYLILPRDFNPDRQYPMIVYVHGGGEGSNLYLDAPLTRGVAAGPLEWHAWAALGYVVFVPDYRSTGGYGPDVITARYKTGEIGSIKDIEDIVSGTRFLIDQGFVDPSKVAILGHSAGGQRVYILLTQHELYAAAILNESISPDPTSLFIEQASGQNTGSYPEGAYRQMYGGGLAEFPDRYKTNYMFDGHKIKTPTLIMLGNEKLGGAYHMPSEILYSILKQHNVPTRLLKFVEEGHVYTHRESAKLAFEETRRWLEAHILQRDAKQTKRQRSCKNEDQDRRLACR
ncbi:MAG: alpha/beta fold hydrolase [Woeseiaceae bacterium]